MRINEIFYSIQGEGRFAGTPSVFIRLSGCNLHCEFCDTIHEPYGEMTEDDIVRYITQFPTSRVVITGGEPLLQLTKELVDRLHEEGRVVQIETNGTIPLGGLDIDWVTCSPKFQFCSGAKLQLERIDELKVVYQGQDMSPYDDVLAREYYVQPCDMGNKKQNAKIIDSTINFIKNNPKWKLSLQTHKILNVR